VAHVRLIHWNGPEGRELKLRLASLGHHADFDELERLALQRILRGDPPEAFVIDLSRMPSQGREFAMYVRASKATRHVPIVFVDGDPAKVAKLRSLLPDATYTSWPKIDAALAKAISRPVKFPVVPPSSLYAGKPVVEKLGIKATMRVCLVSAPRAFATSLAPLPDGVTFTARPTAQCDLFVVFVRRRQELAAQLITLAGHVTRQTAWMAWPKKASGVTSDLDGNVVRETGLASGWIDFKVCSIDEVWSGLAFKRQK
jgi:CheY-like chemotaxis protein